MLISTAWAMQARCRIYIYIYMYLHLDLLTTNSMPIEKNQLRD